MHSQINKSVTVPFNNSFRRRDKNDSPTKFETMLADADVVSFDLFDTLIHRANLFSPKDVFYQVQEQGKQRLDIPLDRFVPMRIHAEERARVVAHGRNLQETTLDEIYNQLERSLGLEPETAACLKEIELECERSVLIALESGQRLFQTALTMGKTVVVVSDTYFDEQFIAEIIHNLGYNPGKIYVSSTYGKSKAEGDLYDVVLKDLGVPPSRMIHVGDNQLVDVTMALNHGIRAYFVPTSKHHLKWRHGLSDTSSGNLVMSKILYDLSQDSVIEDTPDRRATLARAGRHNVGVLYFGYAAWLLDKLRNGGYKRVYFAAREGLIMKQCFDLVAAHAGFEIDTRYLYVSRAALYPSLVFTDPQMARRLFAHSWDHLTIEEALRRIALRYEDCVDELARFGLADRKRRLELATYRQFLAFLEAIWQRVERSHAEHYDLTIDYLRQELMLSDERAAFVDIGWHGSLQNCLVKLLDHIGIKKELHGYYLGTFEKPAGSAATFHSQGFLVNGGEPASIAHLVRFGPSVIELLHSAGHGSVLGYKRDGAHVAPVLQQNPAEEKQYQAVIAPLQKIALDFIADALALEPMAAIHAPDPALIARTALRLIYDPTPAEAEVFGRLQIASDFGGRLKSITGSSEWDLASIEGDTLPDGQIPIWRPGFQVLKKHRH